MPFTDFSGRFKPSPGALDPRFQPVATVSVVVSTEVDKIVYVRLRMVPGSAATGVSLVPTTSCGEITCVPGSEATSIRIV